MQLIEIGEIVRTKGLDGTVKVSLFSENVEAMLNVKSFYINNENFNVKKSYFASGFIFITFEEINSIELAEKYVNEKVFVELDNVAKLENNERFVKDIIGYDVYLTNGKEVGRLVNVENYGATDIAIINTRRQEIMVPIIDGLIEDFETNKVIFNEKIFREQTEEFIDEN